MEQTLPHENSELNVFFGTKTPPVDIKNSWEHHWPISGWGNTLPFLPNYLAVCLMTLVLSPLVVALCLFKESGCEEWLDWDEDDPPPGFDWD